MSGTISSPLSSPIAHRLDALAAWRGTLERHIAALSQSLAEHDLLDAGDTTLLASLRERLASDKLVLAFVAEFSRGKSELINAIFFADAGRRVLPATPGRTTMCPVELRHDADGPPQLRLLPIETRLRGLTLADLRHRPEHWHPVPLDPQDPQSLAQALAAVTRTQRVSVEQATALGLWSDTQPEDNPPQAEDGTVEVPAWRHALISYPHPLLKRGLVVIDTPGLNAIGAEPELTLGLLPTAHAIVFVLGADTGVTRSDMAIWREHLGHAGLERFVVLNKIDTLADPLASAAEIEAQIEQQRLLAASTLEMPASRVFALSARDALAARVAPTGSAPAEAAATAALAASRLPALEAALATELLPRQQQLLVQSSVTVLQQLRGTTARRLADRRRQLAEQMLELRGLRGKSGTKLRMLIERVDAEMADFERCTARLAALRAVQQRMLRAMMSLLSSEALRVEVTAMQSAMGARPFNLGARPAFEALLTRLRAKLTSAETQADEMRQMLQASFEQLNTEFGFAFVLAPAPRLKSFAAELELIHTSYSRYLALGQAWRLATPGFAEQFRRMLVSKLRVVFEKSAAELEMWSKAATSQVEVQLRERRRAFGRRRESLQRVQAAAGDLEQRIGEVQVQDEQLTALHRRLEILADEAIVSARTLLAPALVHERTLTDLELRQQRDAA
jgi:hypothetical protein